MVSNKNSFATPLVEKSVQINQLIFKILPPTHFHIFVKNGIFWFKVDNIFKLKYIPFFSFLFLFTILFSVGSCLALPLLQKYQPESNVNVSAIAFGLLYF